jgi:formylglycine-generating enzyme required for sulfatase activity
MTSPIKRSGIGPADLLDAWRTSKSASELDRAATLLGYAYRDPEPLEHIPAKAKEPFSQHNDLAEDKALDIEFPASSAQDRPNSTIFTVSNHKFINEGRPKLNLPAWTSELPAIESNEIWHPKSQAGTWPDLTRKPRLQTVLRQCLKLHYDSQNPDTNKVLDRVSRALSLTNVPMDKLSRRVPKLHLLIDDSRHLRAMLDDAVILRESLRKQWGKKQFSFQGTDKRDDWPISPPNIKSGVFWVIVSDLGLLSNATARHEWQSLLRLLRNKNIAFMVLSPVSVDKLRSTYLGGMPCYSWDRDLRLVSGASNENPERSNTQHPDSVLLKTQETQSIKLKPVQLLLAAISFCIDIEPALLRDVRVYLHLSVDAEAECRQHIDVCDANDNVRLKQAAQDKHRAVFTQHLSSEQQQDIVELVIKYHGHKVQSILDTELDIASQLCHDSVPHAKQAKRRLRRLANTLHKNQNLHLLRSWSRTYLGLQAGGDPQRTAHFYAGVHRDTLISDNPASLELPKGMAYADLLPYLESSEQTSEIHIKQDSAGLFLQSKASVKHAQTRGDITLANCSMRGDRLLINGQLRHITHAELTKKIRLDEFIPPINIETGVEALTIEHLTLKACGDVAALSASANAGVWVSAKQERLPTHYNCQQIQIPAWASKLQQDEFGFYADLEITLTAQSDQAISQRFRWIPGGEFMMGSPANEAERDEYEDYHEVALSQGFWLADTACTQAVWQQVMESNPSDFSVSAQHPVEQVSWSDVQRFIKQLNKQIPSLNAALPSEAQWEYACRAGSITPFNLGDSINSDTVNFDGNRPYGDSDGDSAKSECRERTVEVKHFSENEWGLHQMHGNVWEWCADAWQAQLGTRTVTDPLTIEDDGDSSRRVLRGGSWVNGGRICRSAIRLHDAAEGRLDDVGFRLSLGQELQFSGGGAAINKGRSHGAAEQALARENLKKD